MKAHKIPIFRFFIRKNRARLKQFYDRSSPQTARVSSHTHTHVVPIVLIKYFRISGEKSKLFGLDGCFCTSFLWKYFITYPQYKIIMFCYKKLKLFRAIWIVRSNGTATIKMPNVHNPPELFKHEQDNGLNLMKMFPEHMLYRWRVQ